MGGVYFDAGIGMAYRIALTAALLSLACACDAGQATTPLPTLTLDGPSTVPKHQRVSKDTTCPDDGKCVDQRDLTLECRNGGVVQATLVQPVQGRASLKGVAYKGKSVREETLHTVNLLLQDRPATAVVEMEGYCSAYDADVYINTYADAYLKTRHQQGATIVVSLTADGQESVQVGPAQ